MKLFTVAAVFYLAAPVFPQTYPVWYDTQYDQGDTSLSSVACSNGEYGLQTRGYSTFGDLPTYPYIGGAPQIQGWDSSYCGSCWQFSYTSPNGLGGTFSFTAVNVGEDPNAFTISFVAMNDLTGGNAVALNGVSISVIEEIPALCGL